ncbi:hypothetical protein MUN78_12050 [Leucobacter allii]|uniref:Uncharacterized protein n=1 Tax=Leucobacter allii TaxID=2932247 RepID=A0ABY4FJ36_9MICO|nr:hypothetical protein [Leucobacter allii]UOQ56405.1 hypothetical protein MUN78_12050 [Leucobacter allii]UOR00843.1 hypothetical protein MUN77_11895 [Leucobacter allii]
MPPIESRSDAVRSRNRHLLALLAGVVAALVPFLVQEGVPGYVLYLAVAVVAVAIGARAVRRRGPLLWAAIAGLVLASLILLFAASLLTVGLTRILAG